MYENHFNDMFLRRKATTMPATNQLSMLITLGKNESYWASECERVSERLKLSVVQLDNTYVSISMTTTTTTTTRKVCALTPKVLLSDCVERNTHNFTKNAPHFDATNTNSRKTKKKKKCAHILENICDIIYTVLTTVFNANKLTI